MLKKIQAMQIYSVPPHGNLHIKREKKRVTEYVQFFLFLPYIWFWLDSPISCWVEKLLLVMLKKSVQLYFVTWTFSYYPKSQVSKTRFILHRQWRWFSTSTALTSVSGICLPVNPAGKLIPWMNDIVHRRDGDELFQGRDQPDLMTGSKAGFSADYHLFCPHPLSGLPHSSLPPLPLSLLLLD